jgi:hypothetical protein
MKIKLLTFVLVLSFALPGFALAEVTKPDAKEGVNEKKPCHCQGEKRHHHMMHHDWKAKMAEREQKILTWVNQYTPDKKAEWDKVLNDKKTLHAQWMSPENAANREKWKEQKLAQMKELTKQLDQGKITKEEFMKKIHGGKKMGHWKTFHDLEAAVEAKNDKQAAEQLNQLLGQYKEHNQMLSNLLKK